jgi:RNA polymerase sigma factor (sigma-70 family)
VSADGSLTRLLEAVRRHDEGAARELVERLQPLVARVVHANLPRRDDPEDLMQDVFFKLFTRLDQFRGDVPLEHWASRVALNTCLDRLRRQSARPELRWADLSEEEQILVETVADAQEPTDADAGNALEILNRLLAQLPPKDAWLLRRLELEQKSISEVCEETGWNSGVTRIRAFRARRRLQALYRELESQYQP